MMRKAVLAALAGVLALGANPGVVQAQSLYFTATHTNEIWVASMDGTGTPSVLFSGAGFGTQGPAGIDLDTSTGRLFWGTSNHAELWTGNADGTGAPSYMYSSIAGQQHDAEVDEANARVFFTDQNQGILVGPTDGSGPVTEVYGYGTGNPEAGTPVTVAYDSLGDLIYFGGPGSDDIFVGAADGTSLSALYTAANVRDIAIDPVGGTIYWVDLDSIWAAPIDGSGTPTVLFGDNGGCLRAIEIDLPTRTLFLGEFIVGPDQDDMIWTANADGSGTPTTLHSGDFGGIRGMTLIPEPATLSLLVLGGVLAIRGRR